MRYSFLAVLAASIAVCSCAGHMQHMTTYRGAAKSLTNSECGQFCWSQNPNLSPNKNDLQVCSDDMAASDLFQCADELREKSKKRFVDLRPARDDIEACMKSRGWNRATIAIVICE